MANKQHKNRRIALADYLESIKKRICLHDEENCIIAFGLQYANLYEHFEENDGANGIETFARFYGMNVAVVYFIFWNYKGNKLKSRTIQMIRDY